MRSSVLDMLRLKCLTDIYMEILRGSDLHVPGVQEESLNWRDIFENNNIDSI